MLLYARSGVGVPSSVLQVLVIPSLEEEQNFFVLFHDTWADKDPMADLKAMIAKHIERLGIANPLEASPTLTELINLLSYASKKPVALILDQFKISPLPDRDSLMSLKMSWETSFVHRMSIHV